MLIHRRGDWARGAGAKGPVAVGRHRRVLPNFEILVCSQNLETSTSIHMTMISFLLILETEPHFWVY